MEKNNNEQSGLIRFYIGLFVAFPLPSLIANGIIAFKRITDFHEPSFKAIMGVCAVLSGYYFIRHPLSLYELSIIPAFSLVRYRLWTDTAANLIDFVRGRAVESLYMGTLMLWPFYMILNYMNKTLQAPKQPKAEKERYRVKLEGDDTGKGVYLGSTSGKRNFYLPKSELIKHTALVGTTGSGKTTTIYNIAQYAMLSEQAIIIIDGKGDGALTRRIKAMAKAHGRPYYLFSTNDPRSLGYNPLADGNPTELADKIMSLTEWSEEHYKLSAQRFLQLLFRLFSIKGIEPTLVNVVRYSSRIMFDILIYEEARMEEPEAEKEPENAKDEFSDDLDLDALTDKKQPKMPKKTVKKSSKKKFDMPPEVQDIAAGVESIDRKAIDGLAGRLGVLAEGELGGLLKTRPTGLLRLSEAIGNKGVILYSLDSLTYPEQARLLGRLVVADIKAQISYHGRHRPGERVSLIFDEFNVFVSGSVVDLVNKSRAAGFEAVLAFQSLADIDRLEHGKDIRRQIFQNCNNVIVQRQNDPSDAEELANIIGTEESYQLTHQITDEGATGVGSARSVKRYKRHPDEIKGLKVGQAIVKYHSEKGPKVEKIQVRAL